MIAINNITISTSDLDNIYIELNTLLKEYKDSLLNLTEKINNIQDSNIWIGKDNITFTENYNSYNIYFDKVIKLLTDYNDYLKNTSTIYKTLQTDYSSKNIDA